MRKFGLILVLIVLAGCQNGTGPEGVSRLTMFISGEAESVSSLRLMADLGDLTEIQSRYMQYDEGCTQTIQLLATRLEEAGAEAFMDSFSFYRSGRWVHTANVRAEFPGRVAPERVVLVGAHWDSVDHPESFYDSTARAPGAVDNATGVAGLLELARILARTPTAYTVRLLFFAAEEIGFKGSKPVAQWWDQETGPDSLIVMVNVDMIGYDPDEPDLSLFCSGATVPMAAQLLPLARDLAAPVALDTLDWYNPYNSPGSDHYWFWLEGLPAIWLHEGPDDLFHGANTDADSLAVVQPEMLEAGTRALVALVLQLAHPQLPWPG